MRDQSSGCSAPRRVVVHDYSGHPFQIQLSRELAHRGHLVHHQYCPSYLSGHGDMERRPTDAPTLTITGIRLRLPFARYHAGLRAVQELEYAGRAFLAILRARPDVVVLCNIPLLANFVLVALLAAARVPYVFWHQDVYSQAIRQALDKRLPRALSNVVGGIAEAMERWIARRARKVVAITPSFTEKYQDWGLVEEVYTVIANWAEIDRFTDLSDDRGWLQGSETRSRLLLYSGTLGLKHDPDLLLALARSPRLEDCTLVVVSEGRGRDWLEERKHTVDDGRLILRDFVPFGDLPPILSSADVLISILEPEASRFSVPSKVLTYLCAGRPILAVLDPGNAAATMLSENRAGVVVGDTGAHEVERALRSLLDDSIRMEQLGRSARTLAAHLFDIRRIGDRFEDIILTAQCGPRTRGNPTTSLPERLCGPRPLGRTIR